MRRVSRPLLVLVAASLAFAACRPREGSLRVVKHFVAEQWQAGDDPSMDAVPSAVSGEERRPILSRTAHAPYDDVYETMPFEVPAGARLRFAVGVADGRWPPGVVSGFELTAIEDKLEHRLFRRHLAPAERPRDRRWLDREVDLSAFAGKTLRLRFEAGQKPAQAATAAPLPFWADPRIVVPGEGPPRRNLIIISLDTLRADHLGAYGYPRPTSPTIDSQLAAQGTLFERAYSQFPGTHGSHMSLFTSLYPCEHGLGAKLGPFVRAHSRATTLAELLRNAGYATGAYTEDAYVSWLTGFARGFDSFVEERGVGGGPTGQAEKTFGRALGWLRRHARTPGQPSLPWFLFVHTYQVHYPYTPPAGYVEEVAPDHGEDRASRDAALYDGEIRYTDDLLARFFAELDKLGMSDNTLVVLVSDHGDQFGEHNKWGHGNSLFDGLLHVALIMRGPGLIPVGKRIPATVGLIDVLPTMLDLLGLPPGPWMQGQSLVPLLHDRQLTPRTLYAEVDRYSLVSARRGLLKWIILDGDDPVVKMYNLADDPGEMNDLRPEVATAISKQLLDEFHAICAATPPDPAAAGTPRVDGAVQQKLKALGYVD